MRSRSNSASLANVHRGKFVLRFACPCLFLCLCVSAISPDEPKQAIRPISDADSLLAVYRTDDWGFTFAGSPSIIFMAWPDGHVIWSGDPLRGGPPYRAGQVDPKKFAGLIARFDKDGLFDDKSLNQSQLGPDSPFIRVFIKSGKKQVDMQSWHELYEASDNCVCDQNGASILEGRRRLNVLGKAPAEYLFFRFVWSETRAKLKDLIPAESSPCAGEPIKKDGAVFWQEPASTAKPNSTGDASKK